MGGNSIFDLVENSALGIGRNPSKLDSSALQCRMFRNHSSLLQNLVDVDAVRLEALALLLVDTSGRLRHLLRNSLPFHSHVSGSQSDTLER